MTKNFEIPSSFQVGGQTLNVSYVDHLPYDKLGSCSVCCGTVNIAKHISDGGGQSPSCMMNTFWHEVVHAILDTMSESELSENEKFVCTFSSFLCEAIKSFKYDKNEQEITSGI